MALSDEYIRSEILNEKDRSVVVEASAGTGKTTLLTQRVAALVKGGIPLEQLAVVTFTEAAASELRTRIREELPARDRSTIGQAWITTIHGFASRILREYFHLCGGAPEFSTEAGHFSRSELESYWDIFLSELDPALLRKISSSLRKPGSLKLLDLAERIEEHRWFTDSSPLGDTEGTLRSSIAGLKKQLNDIARRCSKKADSLLGQINAAIKSLDSLPARAINRRGGAAASWGGKASLKDVKELLSSCNSELETINLLHSFLHVLPALDHLVIPFANRMREKWDAEPTRLSFDDLLYKAWLAVNSSQALRKELNARFTHIFIDEFQDTSLVQVNIFAGLLQNSGMQSKLTVVGDPKQSIFGWRSADIETYAETLKKLKHAGALSRTIDVNFRSDISVIKFVNAFGKAIFEQISPEEKPFSCSYSSISPRDGAPTGSLVTIHRLPEMKAAELAELQAENIADLIKNPERTAVLFRTGTHLDSIVQALDRRGIPYRVEATRDFHKRDEAKDMVNLVRAILSPSDDYAMVNVFRSLLFGISDTDITLWRKGNTPATISAALSLLSKLRHVAHALPPGPFVETLFRNTCLLSSVEQSGYQVSRRLGNLRFVLESAYNTDDYPDLLDLLTGRAPVSAEEPSASPEEPTGVVTLTTIHRAKGLAWEHVILANPGTTRGRRCPSLLVNNRDTTAGIKISGTGITARYNSLCARETARSNAEYRRLLYVAVTRARRKLDVFLPVASPQGSPAHIFDTALAAASGLFEENHVDPVKKVRVLQKVNKTVIQSEPNEFVFLYPESLPETNAEQQKQMRLGTEVHAVLETIDFTAPEEWISTNRRDLDKTLEFPDETLGLVLNFFRSFNLDNAEILGREYPLLVNGKQYYIDLLLRRNGVLEAVDYKTDRELSTVQYREKQQIYKNALQKITKTEVKTILVFLRHGVTKEIR